MDGSFLIIHSRDVLLQVVAVAVFLALGFAFYVFFAPFVGKQLFQYIVMGIYTPLLICAFGLYVWCAGADPADPGVFRSKKYLNIPDNNKPTEPNNGGESVCDAKAKAVSEEANNKRKLDMKNGAHCDKETEREGTYFRGILALLPCAYVCSSHEESSCQQSEDGMFYCSLCEVEVYKYSKHCRICDKCVDRFDHHCRWLNNCIGRRNYRKFFTLMVSALLLMDIDEYLHVLCVMDLRLQLILQWSTGILVLILCFLEKKKFSTDISSKLGSSFSVVPFVIVVGISTYDYIIALREQEQLDGGGQQSPQMSTVSSITGLSSASSFNTFHRAALCTPRLFVEDQFDVVPPDNKSVSSLGKKTIPDDQAKKKNPGPVKISPWALARLNAEDVSKAAAEARKKSKILRPITRPNSTFMHETDSSFGSSSRRTGPRPDSSRKRGSRRIRLPADVARLRGPAQPDNHLAPLHLEAPCDYRAGPRVIPGPIGGIIASSSPESSLDSPDIQPCRASSLGPEEGMRLAGLPGVTNHQLDIPFSRSTSDGYDASGGEDSDRVPRRITYKSSNWSKALFGSETERNVSKFVAPSSSSSMLSKF
ncbi:S-acyltransferase [Striga asiatica]|uniref:S-acyltransferase n=1 Tax=Striga asiatica TaxID=4170 RepID=A0A5A7PGY2_STRAF|nr:S-acyltransferase [Striga asiatica]